MTTNHLGQPGHAHVPRDVRGLVAIPREDHVEYLRDSHRRVSPGGRRGHR